VEVVFKTPINPELTKNKK